MHLSSVLKRIRLFKKISYYITILLVLILDQLTKTLFSYKEITVIPHILYFKTSLNPGIVFGWFAYNKLVVYLIPIFIILSILFYYRNNKNMFISIGTSLIAAGLLGNLIDRARLGYVIDFIFVPIIPQLNIASTNIADISLIIGVLILIYHAMKK